MFVWAHGFSSSNFNRVHAAFNKDYRKANPLLVRVWLECQLFPCLVVFVLQDKMHAELRIKVLNVNTRTGTAKRWLAQWLLLMRHNPPNADSVKAQISKISPDVLFAQYALFAEQAREVPLLQKGFAGLFSVVRRSLDLVMRTSKQGSSECWYCGLLKQFLKDGAGFAEKKWIQGSSS